ncbi:MULTISPECIES: hypothetical protein [unclassified Algibacter]|uniref:hypothetical protein n=1 Tax=unclassified Algibacter TaxID=2615009 RepID=UPI00131B5C96|nr:MULTISPECIES: hypothetical protein [unclassified Algibacter]MCL5127712.1 hypothetical protein [Algibacter sp. L4_22]
MKKIIYLFIFSLTVISCGSDDDVTNNQYEFISEYITTVVVGGVVGITERTFEVGEIYNGTNQRNDSIRIRIAEHGKLNDDCPNSWCYQELLDVPAEFLKLHE